jgi:type IV secretory pathway VirB10-like protein
LPVLLTLGLITVAFACVSASQAEAQTIYKYTDKDGAVVLTDKPPSGVKAEPFVTGEPAPKPSTEKKGPAMQAPPPGSMTAEEAIRQRDEKLEEVVKTVENRDREREIERQKRLQEAERLEAEARQPMSSTRENRQSQYELLQEADKLRRME